MNLEQQVCSFDLAKRLKELNVKQNSLFVWEYYDDQCHSVKFIPYAIVPDECNKFSLFSAFTVAELGDMLPSRLNTEPDYLLETFKIINGWIIKYKNYPNKLLSSFVERETHAHFKMLIYLGEADARAKMLIYLIEQNLVSEGWKQQWLTTA